VKAASFTYAACDGIAQALALLAPRPGDAGDGDDALVLPCSGTQSLGPMLNLRLARPARLVDLSRIPALNAVTRLDHALRLGAAVTHARIEDGASAGVPDVTRGLLPSVAANIAYRAVRNRGTLGGSLAHGDPAGDWVSVMTLLDARLLLVGPAGERRVATSVFYAGPYTTALQAGELLAAVEVPVFSPSATWAYRKLCRKPGELADAIAGLWLDPGRGVARAVLGAPDGLPHAIAGHDAVQALRDPAVVGQHLDTLHITDPVQRQWHQAMMRRAWADIDTAWP
jgi:carbon-monoxide dehydrogenase medium subunit